MEELITIHLYYYLPFGFAFLALYFRVMTAIYDFEPRHIGDILARFLYTLFFGTATYSYHLVEHTWFILISLGTLVLFVNESISYFFKEIPIERAKRRCIEQVLLEIKKLQEDGSNG